MATAQLKGGRHVYWAATIIGPSELLNNVRPTTYSFGQRVLHVMEVSPVEYGSNGSTGGIFTHVHILLKVTSSSGNTAQAYRRPVAETLMANLPDNLSLPYLEPVKNRDAWLAYINKTVNPTNRQQAYITDCLAKGFTDSEIRVKLYREFGLGVACKWFDTKQFQLLKDAHQSDISLRMAYTICPEIVADRLFVMLDNMRFSHAPYPGLTQGQYLCMFFHMYMCYLNLNRISNTEDTYGALFIHGPAGTGKSTLFSRMDVFVVAADAKGVGRFQCQQRVLLVDDCTVDFYQANIQTLRPLALGQQLRIKVAGTTQTLSGVWLAITSNQTLHDCCEYDPADMRRYLVCETSHLSDSCSMFCDLVQYRRLLFAEYKRMIELDSWKSSPYYHIPATRMYTQRLLDIAADIDFV